MKKIIANSDEWFDQLNNRWRVLPLGRQHKFMRYFFAAYVLLTAGVIFKVWHDATGPDKKMDIRHIESPELKNKKSPAPLQDTISTMLKNKIYESK